MKICSFKDSDLNDFGKPGDLTHISAHWRATRLLLLALDTVNQAGLDGKKLSDMRIIVGPDTDRGGVSYEIHAKVTHRLANLSGQPRPTEKGQSL